MIAHRDGKHVCYTTTNGRDRHYLGCAHDTPRAAIRHAIPVYVPASRSEQHPDGTGTPNRAAQAAAALTGAPDSLPVPAPASTDAAPDVVPPGDVRALSLGL